MQISIEKDERVEDCVHDILRLEAMLWIAFAPASRQSGNDAVELLRLTLEHQLAT